jgi:SAM-dependent methyltransferase
MSSNVQSNFEIPLEARLRHGDLRILNRGAFAYTVSNLAHYGLRAMVGKRTARTLDVVRSEYDADYRREYWKKDLSIDELVFGNSVTPRWILRDNRPVVGTAREVREYQLGRLKRWVKELVPAQRGRIVEFGCGTGRNLMFLAREFPEIECVGLELTDSSVARAREMADRGGLKIRFEVGDMCGDVSALPRADAAFSMHALEQLPRNFPRAVQNMLALSNNMIFFEPAHELWPRNALALASRLRVRSAGYLDGLYDFLKSDPRFSIKHVELMPVAGNPLNRTVEIIVAAA